MNDLIDKGKRRYGYEQNVERKEKEKRSY